MGANHFSQTVFGPDTGTVRDLVVRWLRAKGYDLQDGAPLAPLDPKRERGALLAWKGDRTVILYGDLMEQQRLVFELKKLDGPLLDYWMHDSDLWGYTLWKDGRAVDAFNSHPTYFGAAEDPTGPADLPALCRALGVEEQQAALEKARTTRSTFAEGPSTAFVTALGAGAAAFQYGYLPQMGWPPEGWTHEHLWFRQAGWDPMAGWTVDRIRVVRHDPNAWKADYSEEELARMEADSQRVQWMGRVASFLLWPLMLPVRAWMWWQMRKIKREALARADGREPTGAPGDDWFAHMEPAFTVTDRTLHNPTHRCTTTQPEGTTIDRHHRIALGQGSVFRFALGEHQVSLTAMMPGPAEKAVTVGMVEMDVSDETLELGPHTVRWFVQSWDNPHVASDDAPQRMWMARGFVAGARAVYQIQTSGSGEPDEAVLDAMKQALTDLRFESATEA